MSATVASIDRFHKTKKGKLVFGILEIGLAYLVVSRAIDTGSLWEWLLGLLLLLGAFNNLVRILFRQVNKDAKNKTVE